ncbi:MAG: enoyl-CoA hydratase [Alphaproteobacteria bacterium]|nr:enoyl-CoA hydratase [Alphaproteobacteria bacterium]
MTTEDMLLEERHGRVALLTMNRPKARNSLSLAMLAELHGAITRLGKDDAIKAIVLAGNGPAFCAGHDLKEMTAARAASDGGQAFFTETMTACSAMMQAVVNCPKPVVAALEGIATAAGCQLVASCDLAVAGDGAQMATPGVNIGLFCSTPMVAVSRNIPRKRVMEMLLTGEMITAQTAAEWGLVNRVVTQGQAVATALELAQSIAAKSAATLRIGIEAFYKQLDMPLDEAYEYTAQVMVMNMMEPDAEEGITAFIEKRPAVWQG